MKFVTEYTKEKVYAGPDIEADTRSQADRIAEESNVEIVGTKE